MEYVGAYRKDIFYVNTKELIRKAGISGCDLMGRRDRVVSPLEWWFHRLQVWRFEKMKRFKVVRER